MTLTGRFLALLSLFALVSVTSTAVSSEGGERFASATIYVVPLNVITRVPMTVDAVVSSPTFLIRIDDSVYATRLWKMIAIDTFKPTRTTSQEEARIVIDLKRVDGSVVRLYGNKQRILTGDSTKYRVLDRGLADGIDLSTWLSP